jgi:hypothetical protein
MSGFLQRIAASSSRPQRNVHPLVDAMFAGKRREETALPLEAANLVESPAVMAEISAVADGCGDGITPREPTSVQSRGEPSENSENRPDQNESQNESKAIQLPVAHEVARIDAPVGREKTSYELWNKNARPPQRLSAANTRREQDEEDAAEAASIRQDQSLIMQPLLAAEIRKEGGIAEDFADADRRPPTDLNIPGRARIVHNQSTQVQTPPIPDIEIHIGRIEVIAVPPPSSRVVAQPKSKTMSLDEYLRRANGRAR